MNTEGKEVSFKSGELALEGRLAVPPGDCPRAAVVLCHPHPLYGGSMDNNVINSLADGLLGAGIAAFKFNFRGVGGSEGEYDGGKGEQGDVLAALAFIGGVADIDPERVGLAGYSAGAGFALPAAVDDRRVKSFAFISAGLEVYGSPGLKNCPKPKLLVSGSADHFAAPDGFLELAVALLEPKEIQVVKGADHFWRGFESSLSPLVTDFFTREL
ncbi:MAG: alpha/beta hydrolase [Chloroflexi bacterium]|nr:alpha/beta hydrolase [Chloroflexota bacterium]